MFPYEHKDSSEVCPNCERCDLTKQGQCNDCGYDKKRKCGSCESILIPPAVFLEEKSYTESFYCPKGHPQPQKAA